MKRDAEALRARHARLFHATQPSTDIALVAYPKVCAPRLVEALRFAQSRPCATCAICGCRRVTGRDRGFLCMKCNTGLGLFQNDPDLLRKAVAYLERWKDFA